MTARRAAGALVVAAWRQQYNRLWRFSPVKAGLWLALAQAGTAAAVFWRLSGRVQVGLVVTITAVALQSALASYLVGFTSGRERLYAARVLPLVHLSPAPPASLLLAQVGADLPQRVWSAALLSTALCALLPTGWRLWGLPLLWLAAVTAGTLGQLAGMLSLVAWVRVAPRALSLVFAAALVLQMLVLGYLLYLGIGGSAAAAAAWAQSARGWLLATLGGFFALPGAAMGLRLLWQPAAAGSAYRSGWLNLQEAAGAGPRPRRSRLPALLPGAAGAVQGKDWLQIARNPFSLLRLGAWTAGLAALFVAAPYLAALEPSRRNLLVLALGLGLTGFAYAELILALFSADGRSAALHVLAGVRPFRLLAGRLLAALPFAPLAGVAVWAAGLAAGLPLSLQARLALAGAALGAGMAAIMVGAAAAGANLRDDQEQTDSEVLAAALEQVPRSVAAWVGFAGGIAYAVIGVLAASGRLQANPPVVASLLLSPLAALLTGFVRLRRWL